jgi:poly [ADP-ribose] polymerase
MVVKENGLKYAKLIHVSVDNGKTDNSNKVYIMEELSDGRIKCEYGRVGKSMAVVYKPNSQWDKILREKTSSNKGYTDVTELLAEPVKTPTTSGNNLIEAIPDSIVRELIQRLTDFANKTIQQNYKVSQDAVSEQQVNAAQEILSSVMTMAKVGVDVKQLNDLLLRLYTVIPRKMDNVKSYLLSDIKTSKDLDDALSFLNQEQSTLDTMAGQVELINKQKELANKDKEVKDTVKPEFTILDQMGITMELVTDNKVIEAVKKQLEGHARKLNKVYAVVNTKTQPRFDKKVDESKNKLVELLFHGSRNANWFNILQTGLMIRPSGAGYNGSMWDDGVYFANDADKSMGYTDGGRWAGGGSASYTYLGLVQVHLGNQLHAYQHDSSSYTISKRVKAEGFDSVYAHKGASLRKDELIIYNAAQCTVKYLVELRN